VSRAKDAHCSLVIIIRLSAIRRTSAVRAITGNLFRALRTGILRPNIGLTLPLREAAEAHRALEGRRSSGSIILIA
jgi:NADPH:quinone reductase-like Zn-dependent oxidoreductase